MHDKSEINVRLEDHVLDNGDHTPISMRLWISGSGKRPHDWEATLFVDENAPDDKPDFWGEHPVFKIRPGDFSLDEIKKYRTIPKGPKRSFLERSEAFSMPLSMAADLVDYRQFSLNGFLVKLSETEIATIKDAITAVRECSNADK